MFIRILTEHGRYTTALNRLVTAGTQGALLGMEMRLTVRSPFVLEKRSGSELTATVRADKALRMPLAIQCGDECGSNWFTWREKVEFGQSI